MQRENAGRHIGFAAAGPMTRGQHGLAARLKAAARILQIEDETARLRALGPRGRATRTSGTWSAQAKVCLNASHRAAFMALAFCG